MFATSAAEGMLAWQACRCALGTFRKVLQPMVGVARAKGVPWVNKCAREVLPLPAELAHVKSLTRTRGTQSQWHAW